MGLLDKLEDKVAILFLKKKIKQLGSNIQGMTSALSSKQKGLIAKIGAKIVERYVDEDLGRSVANVFTGPDEEVEALKREIEELKKQIPKYDEKTGERIHEQQKG